MVAVKFRQDLARFRPGSTSLGDAVELGLVPVQVRVADLQQLRGWENVIAKFSGRTSFGPSKGRRVCGSSYLILTDIVHIEDSEYPEHNERNGAFRGQDL